MAIQNRTKKTEYIQEEINKFKKGLPLFFGFNILLIAVLLIVIFSLNLLITTGFDIISSGDTYKMFFMIQSFCFIILVVIIPGTFKKLFSLYLFYRDKNSFKLNQESAEIAINILEQSPLVISKFLNTPDFKRRKNVINLLRFCNFVKIKNNKVYQTGLLLIE